ncbi:MAG TPA: MarR family winged helix-turn-helix transcriptional regulator [Actinomycetota bacterium]|nr:MarR family winged helix-turn-helix transcriptional regulator [Actinomycetota bacterium]
MSASLTDQQYRRLLDFRVGLRRFLHRSEELAEAAGITPAQHQLLLAVRGFEDPRGPTIGDIAGLLVLRHHSAVGLSDRAVAAGLVRRTKDPHDHRVVRLALTPLGRGRLAALSALHLEELKRLSPHLEGLWRGLEDDRSG